MLERLFVQTNKLCPLSRVRPNKPHFSKEKLNSFFNTVNLAWGNVFAECAEATLARAVH